MRISFCYPDADHTPWLAALRAQLPQGSVEAWKPGAAPADYGVVWAPPQQFIDEQSGLKALFNIGAGVDRLMQLRLPPLLKVVRLDDAGMAVQMAEYVCHAVSRHFREFAQYEAQAQQGQWLQRRPRVRADFTVGILGLGVLGSRVAQVMRQFEYPVIGWSRSTHSVEGARSYSGAAELPQFLAACRALVCLLPLTAATRDILGRANLSLLPRGAYVVNVARGALLVEDDLLALLDSGHLAGATLDVFRSEPLPATHALWRHPAVRVTPHTSAQTLEAESIVQIAGKIRALERGEAVAGVVNLARGY
ncbi:MAG: glyoxylate/hydroxypyruvate reductase A [Burkholderiaceae bacterium]